MENGTDKKSLNVKESRRTRFACDECHKRRIKCDGQSPCGTCIRTMNYCTIARKLSKRGPKAGHIEYLESRLKLIESILTPEQVKTLDQMSGQNTDEMVFGQEDVQSLRATSDDDLRLDLISLYFNHVHHKIPFLHEHSFMQNIRGHRACLIYMMYALGSIYQDYEGMDTRTHSGDFYYELAVNEINQLQVEVTDYHLIGACLLLFKYCKGSGRMSSGTAFYSRGTDLLIKSRFHEDLVFYPDGNNSHKITETDREIRRRLFWLYYEYGLYAAFILGQPPLLPEDIYNGILPMDDESFNLIASLEKKYGSAYFMQNLLDDNVRTKTYPITFPLEDLSEKHEGPTNSWIHLMRIMKVFEKIMQLNQSYLDTNIEQAKLDILRRQIDISLLNWNISFQIWLTKDSFFILSDNLSLPTAPWMSTFLEVVYHFCIICIHRPLIMKNFLKNSSTGSLTLFTHPSCSLVENSTSIISAILQKNDFANFFINAPSFTHTIIFHLGLTYGILLHVSSHSPNCTRYIRQINACVSALSTLSRYFSPTRNKWDILRKIATTFYRKKTEEELNNQLHLFRESILQGYPLIGPYVSPQDIEEYSKSRKILSEQRFRILK